MQKLKLLIVLTIACLNLHSQTDRKKADWKSISKTEIDIYYINQKPKIVDSKLYNGTDTSYYQDIINGNEILLAIESFKDGFKTELKTFYDNGQPECHFQWKNGKRDGISKKWYKSGKIKFDDIMKDGQYVGTSLHFY